MPQQFKRERESLCEIMHTTQKLIKKMNFKSAQMSTIVSLKNYK